MTMVFRLSSWFYNLKFASLAALFVSSRKERCVTRQKRLPDGEYLSCRWLLEVICDFWVQLETGDIILFFIFCWLYFSTHSPMSKTSGMSQNIGVTSLTTLGVIQEPIGVIPKSATYSLYSVFFFFFRVFQESQGKREASVERGKRPFSVP